MSTQLTTDVNTNFEVPRVKYEPFDVLLRIIAAIPQDSGLKDENGHLKVLYSDDVGSSFSQRQLRYDAAVLADVACYRMTTYHGNKGDISETVVNIDAILEAVKNIGESNNPSLAFQTISREAHRTRDELDGRQTDHEDWFNYNKRVDLATRYVREIVSPRPPIIKEPKVLRAG